MPLDITIPGIDMFARRSDAPDLHQTHRPAANSGRMCFGPVWSVPVGDTESDPKLTSLNLMDDGSRRSAASAGSPRNRRQRHTPD